MKIELIKWDLSLQEELKNICNAVDRSFLSNRLPFPYTTDNAKWWLTMVSEHDGKDGVFRAISVDHVNLNTNSSSASCSHIDIINKLASKKSPILTHVTRFAS